jgi:hypothetical protein
MLDDIQSISALIKRSPSLYAKEIAAISGIRYNTIRLQGRVADDGLDLYDATSGLGFRL